MLKNLFNNTKYRYCCSQQYLPRLSLRSAPERVFCFYTLSMKYTKPPLRFEKQIELLESRGLIIPDKADYRTYKEQRNNVFRRRNRIFRKP